MPRRGPESCDVSCARNGVTDLEAGLSRGESMVAAMAFEPSLAQLLSQGLCRQGVEMTTGRA